MSDPSIAHMASISERLDRWKAAVGRAVQLRRGVEAKAQRASEAARVARVAEQAAAEAEQAAAEAERVAAEAEQAAEEE